uniref:Uncharacterized protein n=1 Tax=Oncorhynchus tshawytscha TaxID=74940 RepID=A0A8C8HFK9_ONCTS
MGVLSQKLFPIVEAMQKHFSVDDNCWNILNDYFSFFLSVLSSMSPKSVCIVLLDVDLKYRSNIRELFLEFDRFPSGVVIGIAREMQPVYRHTFWQYRKENPQSCVGEPPADGLPGFNSGLLEPRNVSLLADQYHFRGYLGDQDFFTMISMEHSRLIHSLACGWNCAPGGGSTDTGTCSSSTTTVTGRCISTMETVIRPYPMTELGPRKLFSKMVGLDQILGCGELIISLGSRLGSGEK